MKIRRLMPPFFLAGFLMGCTLVAGLTAQSPNPALVARNRTPFLDPRSLDLSAILPPPPVTGSPEARSDSSYLKFSGAAAPPIQKLLAIEASRDGVFDYSQTLGPWFNPTVLPKTAALFSEVSEETNKAIELAKNHFKRIRPDQWKETGDPDKSDGYCYPSGHTTRAYVWSTLLANAFPDQAKELHFQARQKAWYRVILGRHYPSDVRAGKTYGRYLAKQFLKNAGFQREWKDACAEMRKEWADAIAPASFKL